jgi:hypothetical protein
VKSILGFLANLLLFLSISTLLFSIAAYFAFKIKGKRKPKARASQAPKAAGSVPLEPALLQQYVQPDQTPSPVKAKSSDKHQRSKSRSV